MKNGIWKEFFGRLFSKAKEEEIELVKISGSVLGYYRSKVKGNWKISEDQARRKMTRNMELAVRFKEENMDTENHRVWYSYGCLNFAVQNGEVIRMKNWCKVRKNWKMDYEKYEILNKKLGIVADGKYGYQNEKEKIIS